MHIKKFISQNRRDFRAIYVCEHCGAEEEGQGYDDENFHQNVIPQKKCKQCGKVAGEGYRAYAPKHAASEVL
jgi:ribosomal protein L37AE/L43A